MAPVRSDAAGHSFIGVVYDQPVVARVEVTSGESPLGAGIDDLSAGGAYDLVVTDDFLFGEPQLAESALAGAAPSGAAHSPLDIPRPQHGEIPSRYPRYPRLRCCSSCRPAPVRICRPAPARSRRTRWRSRPPISRSGPRTLFAPDSPESGSSTTVPSRHHAQLARLENGPYDHRVARQPDRRLRSRRPGSPSSAAPTFPVPGGPSEILVTLECRIVRAALLRQVARRRGPPGQGHVRGR